MTLLKISHESSLLALQVEAPPVMSCDIITEIWLLKGDLLSENIQRTNFWLLHRLGLLRDVSGNRDVGG